MRKAPRGIWPRQTSDFHYHRIYINAVVVDYWLQAERKVADSELDGLARVYSPSSLRMTIPADVKTPRCLRNDVSHSPEAWQSPLYPIGWTSRRMRTSASLRGFE